MARSGEDKTSKTIEGELIPFKGTPIRTRLGTIKDIKNEMARVYKEVRMGSLDTSQATKLIYILGQMSALIKDHELERRIELLERSQNESKK